MGLAPIKEVFLKMTGIGLGIRGLLSMLATKGIAVVAIGAALGTGGAVIAARQLSSSPASTHGAAVVTAIRGSCAQLRPGSKTAVASSTPSPGAFGQCVSRVARSNHGTPTIDATPSRGSEAKAGKAAPLGPPSWAKGRGQGRHGDSGTTGTSAP